MKKTTMVLALMAVVAMTSACFAEVTYSVNRLPVDPAPGLAAFVVHFNGTNAFENLKIMNEEHTALGVIHQANLPRSSTKIYPTVWLDEFDLPTEATVLPLDSHFLYAAEAVAADGTAAVETNDRLNPAVLPENEFGYLYGNGTLDGTGLRFAVKGDMNPNGYDLLQVVLAPDVTKRVFLTGLYWEYGGGAPGYRTMDIEIVVPEPGTIALLIAGALGLLVVRLRRK